MELFFEKWKSYCYQNPTIDDEIIGSIRNLEPEVWFVLIASQIEKSCLILIEKITQIKTTKATKKVLDLKIIVWKFSNKMAGK